MPVTALAMLTFEDSSTLVDDPGALRSRFAEEGYVFLRQVIDRDLLLHVRASITAIMADAGWLVRGTDPMVAIPAVPPRLEGEESFFEVYDEIQKLEVFHSVPHDESVRAVMTALLGESVFPHPLSIARVAFPGNHEWATPPHQDYPNNQGTQALTACWIPLGACPVQLGGLSVLRGSHRLGLAPVEFSLGAGNRQARLDARFDTLDWVRGDFEAGDAIVFHSMTVHRSLPNRSERLRLSVDYRFQPEGEALTEQCLEPHFSPRLAWNDIYRGWERRDLQYYWESKRYRIVPWDPSLHQLPSDHLDEAVQSRAASRPDEFGKDLVEAILQSPEDLKVVQERMRQRAREHREESVRTPAIDDTEADAGRDEV